ncbi:MAG: hypothetical protein LUD76_07250 [Alistipes sp.]|nr:hypothetical protein [Alistipes sp.]MCD8173237.1 hypothetical protein [Alistipes sp.]
MKKVLQIVLGLAIIGLIYVLYNQFHTPISFKKEVAAREAAVIERIKDIRTAQQAYKQKYQKYTPSFDSLINFILSDTLTFERTIGSKDDSVAVARGLVRTETFSIPVKDTIFSNRNLSVDDIRNLKYIPFTDNKAEFIMDAGDFETDSKVVVPVFEAKAPYKVFLGDLNRQEVINLIDDAKTLDKYPGIKVGSMEQATNDAGNWE